MAPTNAIIMIRPCSFGYNEQTANSNRFQQKGEGDSTAQSQALQEFDKMVMQLRTVGISVTVFEDTPEPHTPDSIFPNNWFATHHDGIVAIFPMEAENRRLERREDVIHHLESNFRCERIIDFTDAENIGCYLEGTGSIVFDHSKRLAFACRSSRTHENLLRDYCEAINYFPVVFDAADQNNSPIYHTNVLMNVGSNYIVLCLDAIPQNQQPFLLEKTKETGKELLTISPDQMNAFAGNMLELQGDQGAFTVLSQTAFEALTTEQKAIISNTSQLLPITIPTIERIGGGSVRCMIAENFLPKL